MESWRGRAVLVSSGHVIRPQQNGFYVPGFCSRKVENGRFQK